MLRKKKKKSAEVRWLITFADLITLLFCFFVYLSLFSKPSVSLETQFRITDSVLRILGDVMPINVVSSVQSIKDQTFPSEAYMVEQIENLLGEKDAAEFKNQIVLESVSDLMIPESSKIANIRVQLSEPLLEDLEVPLLFGGSARKGPVNPGLCNEEGLVQQLESLYRFDYLLPSESIIIPEGEQSASIYLCLVDDQMYESTESILVQIGNVRGNVDRGAIISRNIVIEDNEIPPEVAFSMKKREIYEGRVSITVTLNRISGLKSEIPLRFLGTATEGVDFRLIDPPQVTIFPFTEKGSILLDIIQEDVPLYATRTLIVEMEDDKLRNVQSGSVTRQVNTIIGALEMKDCSGINRFLRENHDIFASFELNASKSRCILSLPSDFLFESGSAQLKEKHLKKLGRFMREIRTRYELEGDVIRVEGHTDDVPMGKKANFANNWELSVARATNVGVFMIEKNGYDPNLISITGHADTRPRTSYTNDSGKRKQGSVLRQARHANRRVDLIFARPAASEQIRRFFPEQE
ncbi:MAG: OmpA family protein [SAR324 cluster bacterium]|nr:OmpA family protein [SAR324 cluster bacterium]